MSVSEVRTVTVRLPEPLHRAVKVRCAERGDSLEGVARAAFVAYLERDASEPGSVLERAGVRPAGLAAGEGSGSSQRTDLPVDARRGREGGHSRTPDPKSSPAASPSFRPDPKGGSKT